MNAKAPDYDCPATGFRKKCSKLRDNCPKWVFVDGKHPQTEELIRRYDCIDAWLAVLLVDNFRITEQVVSTLDLARKENIEAANKTRQMIAHAAALQVRAMDEIAPRDPNEAIEINGSDEVPDGRRLDHG